MVYFRRQPSTFLQNFIHLRQSAAELLLFVQKFKMAAANLKLNCLIFLYQSKQLTDYIYTDMYCELLKCTGQTPCSYEHYLVN